VTPEDAISQTRTGAIGPVYLVTGEEAFLVERVVGALREGALGGGLPQLNEEKLVAGEVDVDRIVSAARVLPMMAKRRVIIVRSLERWDARSQEEGAPKSDELDTGRASPLDRLAAYAENPVGTTCLVLVGTKIDGRRKLVTLARKAGWLVACDPLPRAALPAFVIREAKARGHAVDPQIADMLAEIAGPELATVADAIERLSLYVGTGQPFTEDAIAACLVKMRPSTVWEMINAVGRRDLGPALSALEDVYDARDRGLRLVGLLAWSVRQLIKFDAAVREGLPPEEAAKRAGAPPFKARELAAQMRRLSPADLERWVLLLAEADLELKGSKRPARATIEDALMLMCRGPSGAPPNRPAGRKAGTT
jgi:DNA polymerase-3 subunit delta